MELIADDNNIQSTPEKLTSTQFLAFGAMIIGMFMAILDIQIVASSISVIGAGLSASHEELAWVQTSYLIAEVIVIPISGYMVRIMSTRFAYSIAAAGFTFTSFLCSVAWNIESMIIFRALQGFFGGAMIPTVFATSFMIFPKEQRPTVSMVIGLVVSVAPTIGPTLGGYITDAISWHFIFLVNIIPGIFVAITVFFYADFDKPNLKLLENLDYMGAILLAVSLASLEYVLEEGNTKGWLDDNLILSLILIIICSFVCFIYRELTFKNPILDLKVFLNRNFTLGCLLSMILGVGLFCSIYLMPLYLAVVAGMSTLQIGLVMVVTGVFQFLSAPIANIYYKLIEDKRLVMVSGMLLYATGCFLNSYLTADSRFYELFWPQAIRGFALMFCFMPVNNITLDDIPRESLQNASSIYNLMRNLGGAIGLALINNYINTNTKILNAYFNEHLHNTSIISYQAISRFKAILQGYVVDTNTAALTILNSMNYKQAYIISINNSFMIISCLFVFSLLILSLVKKI